MANNQEMIAIEVVYVNSMRQYLISVQVPVGTTISAAIESSGLLVQCPELILDKLNVGIFSKIRSLDWIVVSGDRIEIYRDLTQDPKAARLQRAKKHKQKQNAKKTKN